MKSRKGLSGVVTTVIMIALVMAAIVLVWGFIRNMLEENLQDSESCFGKFDLVTLNSKYTCYNSSSGMFQFSINVGAVEPEEAIIGIDIGDGSTKSFTLKSLEESIDNLFPYPAGSGSVALPKKNSGLTYLTPMETKPDSIKISPVIGKNNCGISDTITSIPDCLLLN